MRDEAANNLPGAVEKIIKPTVPGEAEKVEISIPTGPTRIRKFELQTL